MHPSKEFQHIGRFSRTLEIWQIVNTSINPITIPPLDLKLSAGPVTLQYKPGKWIPGPDPPLFILESRVLWWPLYYDVTSCSADGNFEVTLATKATLMASGKGALNKLRLPTFITITMPLPQKFSLQNCTIKLGHLLVGKRTTYQCKMV